MALPTRSGLAWRRPNRSAERRKLIALNKLGDAAAVVRREWLRLVVVAQASPTTAASPNLFKAMVAALLLFGLLPSEPAPGQPSTIGVVGVAQDVSVKPYWRCRPVRYRREFT